MLQSTCDKIFNIKNPDNKVFLFSKLLAQKIDMVKNDHMHTAESLVNTLKLTLLPFHNFVVADTALSTHGLGQLISGAFTAADAMSNNNITHENMHNLDVNLDGIWQLANPVPMPNPNSPCMPPMPNPGMTIDLFMLQNMVSPFLNKDCAHTDFNMLANDLQMAMNNPMCNNYMPPMPPVSPMNVWGMDNFELYGKCQDMSELVQVVHALNTPM